MHPSRSLLIFIMVCGKIYGQDIKSCSYVTIPVCGNEEVNTVLQNGGQQARRLVGPPGTMGKRGPEGRPGVKGQKGDIGSPGVDGRNVAPEHVEDMVNRKVKEKEQQILKMTASDLCLTAESGIHTVFGDLFVCDGEGWTVFQRRMNGSVNFHRNWMDYSAGFGNLDGEFWLGLKTLHKLTRDRQCKLRVDMAAFDQETAYAEYSSFKVDDEENKFRLAVSGYSGNAGDSLSYHSGQKFTTKDNDNDGHGTSNCASNHGGWWFLSCFYSSLNAPWGRSTGKWANILWRGWKGDYQALQSSTMKIQCD